MESVQIEDTLKDFFDRFILSIYSKVHFCIDFNCEVKLMEYQDSGQKPGQCQGFLP